MEQRYELRGKIGQGGIGRVFRAYDHKMKREVAIKRILTSAEDATLEEEAIKQLMTEVGALASLQHPHIVTVFDVGEDEEGPYVVMELINGKTLDEIVESAPLVWHDFKIVATQSLEALIAAQEIEMIHSDLKPPNIMLTWLPSGAFQIKIVDFGLAVLIQNQSQEEIEKLDSIFGSIFFMPPEQYERKVLDTRSDLYSLGCCFYQALTGTYPFNGTTGMEVMQAHLNHTVRPIQELRGDIPLWACNWVMWLINRYPDDRPASAREALSNFLQNDKETSPIMSRGAAHGKHPRLIIPGPIATTTGPVPISPLTGTVPLVPLTTAAHAVVSTGETGVPDAAVQEPAKSKKVLIISISVAALVIVAAIVGFLIMGSSSEDERAIQEMAAIAGRGDVKDVRITKDKLQLVLDHITNAKPDAYLAPAISILAKAKATDGSDFDAIITGYATAPGTREDVRRKLFDEVIRKRASQQSVVTILKYIPAAKKPAEAEAAFNAVRNLIREQHAEAILNILTSAEDSVIRQAAEASMEQIISLSLNRNELASLISKASQSATNSSHRGDLNRLLAKCKPQQTTNQGSPTPAPTPAPKPQPQQPATSPTGNASSSSNSFIDAFAKMDDAAKMETISNLAKAPPKDDQAHQQLLDIYARHSNLKSQIMGALVELNSSPEVLLNARNAQQRWLQMIWRSDTAETKKSIIDALAKIKADWAINHIEQMTRGSDTNVTSHAKKALEQIKGGASGGN